MSNNRIAQPGNLAGMFKALGNPHRVRILRRLMACCPGKTGRPVNGDYGACVGEIGAHLEIGPSTVSHHLKELDRAGLIEMEREGQRIRCRVANESLELLQQFLGSELPEWDDD